MAWCGGDGFEVQILEVSVLRPCLPLSPPVSPCLRPRTRLARTVARVEDSPAIADIRVHIDTLEYTRGGRDRRVLEHWRRAGPQFNGARHHGNSMRILAGGG